MPLLNPFSAGTCFGTIMTTNKCRVLESLWETIPATCTLYELSLLDSLSQQQRLPIPVIMP